MSTSLVINSAIQAFKSASSHPADQPQLAYLRQAQTELFEDIKTTLESIQIAPDILASSAGGQIGKSFVLLPNKLANWLGTYPNGTAWPITVAQKATEGTIDMPMRIVLMVPMNSPNGNLWVPRALAKHFLKSAPQKEIGQWSGASAAVFLGLQCDVDGQWEYGLAAAWCCVADSALTQALPILPEQLAALAQRSDIHLVEASMQNLRDTLFDEIGIISNQT